LIRPPVDCSIPRFAGFFVRPCNLPFPVSPVRPLAPPYHFFPVSLRRKRYGGFPASFSGLDCDLPDDRVSF
jgi:hypothetical protein